MAPPEPLSGSAKVTISLLLGAFFILGLAAGIEVFRWSSDKAPASGGVAPALGVFPAARRLRFAELLSILSEKGSHPLALRFAEDFQSDRGLRDAWEEYRRTDDMGAFVDRLGRSEAFAGLLDRHGKDAGFQEIAESLANHPSIAPWLTEDAPGGARAADARPSGLSMIRNSAPGRTSESAGFRAYRALSLGGGGTFTRPVQAERTAANAMPRYSDPEKPSRYQEIEAPIPEVSGSPVSIQGVGILTSGTKPTVLGAKPGGSDAKPTDAGADAKGGKPGGSGGTLSPMQERATQGAETASPMQQRKLQSASRTK
ncbi:MAG: hypothetical protein WC728_18945 [Elusimicrobiota bacterium]